MERSIPTGIIALVMATTTISSASLISTGPNGIESRSARVRLPDGVTPLTGAGVIIGQVERFRPGWPIEGRGWQHAIDSRDGLDCEHV